MEKFHCEKAKQHKDKKHRIGLIFLLIGLVLLGNNLHLIPIHLSSVIFSWQMLLIAIGLIMVITNRRNVGGLVMIAVGGLFLWNKIMPLSPVQWEIAWPGIFIVIGCILIFGYLLKPSKQQQPEYNSNKKKTKYDDVEFDIDKIEPIEN